MRSVSISIGPLVRRINDSLIKKTQYFFSQTVRRFKLRLQKEVVGRDSQTEQDNITACIHKMLTNYA